MVCDHLHHSRYTCSTFALTLCGMYGYPTGVDPKSIVCEFFRHGQCTKGFKCKFSHDLTVERKGAKIDLFTDQRDIGKEGEEGEEVRVCVCVCVYACVCV